jgi:nicotinate-nucleotide adenylyltransferase
LGGTFDPVHHGHLRLALEALEKLGLAEVRFIPCHHPPHRERPIATAEQRLTLLQIATADQTGFVVDDRELHRAGPSYMADTLNSLRAQWGNKIPLCLLLGTDALTGLPHWHRWQELPELTHLVVINRPGTSVTLFQMLETIYGWRRLQQPKSLNEQPAGGILFQSMTQLDISATQIRQMLATGKSPRYLLPEAVLTYIRDQNLYRSQSSYSS